MTPSEKKGSGCQKTQYSVKVLRTLSKAVSVLFLTFVDLKMAHNCIPSDALLKYLLVRPKSPHLVLSKEYVPLKVSDRRTLSDETFGLLEMFAINILNVVVGVTFYFLLTC